MCRELEEKVRLLQEDLKKKNQELEKLDQLKSEFVSTVSHELRTPLSNAKEAVSLVLDRIPGPINEKQERILACARENIDRLARIINELLDISKIEAGKVELKRQLTDIRELVKKVMLSFEGRAKNKGLQMKADFGPDKGIYLYVDADKLIQVFSNLLSNALKFTAQGYIEIRLRDLKDEVECSVADTGIGICEEDLPKIFAKFQQFSRTPGPGEKGTGLGLSIARGIIELHKGRIWVESASGQGTKLTFILPKYTSLMVFKEYINDAIKDAVRHDSRMSLVVISIVNFEKIKEEVSEDKIRLMLASLEGVVRNSLRRKGDMVARDTGDIIVILVDCAKEDALIVEGRLQQAVKDYLEKEKLTVRLRFGCVTYPDEAKTDEELIRRAKEA